MKSTILKLCTMYMIATCYARAQAKIEVVFQAANELNFHLKSVVLTKFRSDNSPGVPTPKVVETEKGNKIEVTLAPNEKAILCVPDGGEFLDPCRWSGPIVISSQQADRVMTINLTKGAKVTIRIVDPNQLIAAARDRLKNGIDFGKGFLNASIVDAEGKKINFVYSMSGQSTYEYGAWVVPGKRYTVELNSHHFVLESLNGRGISGQNFIDSVEVPSLDASLTRPKNLPLGRAADAVAKTLVFQVLR